MPKTSELNDDQIAELDAFLVRVDGGKIPNCEALDGFFAALACCPDLVMPSEYLPEIQCGKTEQGDLDFKNVSEAERFMELVNQHWNHVNAQLNKGDLFLPLVFEDENGDVRCNDWANGFSTGVDMRPDIWTEFMDDEEHGGAIVPIMALAHENHPDPDMRPYKEPMDKEQREKLFVGAAAGVMQMHRYFLDQRIEYAPPSRTFVRSGPKTDRNEPCPCGSRKKYKQCCGRGPTLH
jgi:uncharacterized protein